MKTPLVSVIIPTYGHRNYILDTLESVFSQEFSDLEVIVINDGSPDDTEELLRPLVEKQQIYYVFQKNQGQAVARNRGIMLAKGKYVALLDDDDVWTVGKLQWQVECLEQDPKATMVYGQAEIMGQGSATIHPGQAAPEVDPFDAFIGEGWIRSPGQTLIRTDVLRSIGGFDERIWGTDDWDLWLRLAKFGHFIYRPRVALLYRVHLDNASKRFWRMFRNGTRVVEKHFGFVPRLGNLGRWTRAQKFVRSFASFDGMCEADRLSREGRAMRAAWALFLSILIWPPLLKQRSTWRLISRHPCYGR